MDETDEIEREIAEMDDPLLQADDMDLAQMLSTSLAQVSSQQEQLGTMLNQLAQMVATLANQIEHLGAYVTAPKQIVRDSNGRPVGVQIKGITNG